ncbi:MAG: hypothetical protein KDC98_17050 [Planctomycetes bacterium]|nr:hypothetical protein [Planctomycetota bacterium]
MVDQNRSPSRVLARWIGIAYLTIAGLMLLFPDGMLHVIVPLIRPAFGPGGCGSSFILFGVGLVLCTTCGVALLLRPRFGAFWCIAMGVAPALLAFSELMQRAGGRVVGVSLFLGVQVAIAAIVLGHRATKVAAAPAESPSDPIGQA